jgi:putative nucleotidyltransferase with HDIG domain
MNEAVTWLGLGEILRLVAVVLGRSALGIEQAGYGIAGGELWQHSAAAAVAAKTISRALGDDENVAFTAALLHDIGKLVLNAALEGSAPALASEIEQAGRSFLEAEKLLLGVEHAEVGGRLLARWKFPPALVQAVWRHHDPSQAGPHARVAGCVYLADLVAHFLGFSHGHYSYAVRGRVQALELLGLTSQDLECFLIETDAALKATRWFAPDGA